MISWDDIAKIAAIVIIGLVAFAAMIFILSWIGPPPL